MFQDDHKSRDSLGSELTPDVESVIDSQPGSDIVERSNESKIKTAKSRIEVMLSKFYRFKVK